MHKLEVTDPDGEEILEVEAEGSVAMQGIMRWMKPVA